MKQKINYSPHFLPSNINWREGKCNMNLPTQMQRSSIFFSTSAPHSVSIRCLHQSGFSVYICGLPAFRIIHRICMVIVKGASETDGTHLHCPPPAHRRKPHSFRFWLEIYRSEIHSRLSTGYQPVWLALADGCFVLV